MELTSVSFVLNSSLHGKISERIIFAVGNFSNALLLFQLACWQSLWSRCYSFSRSLVPVCTRMMMVFALSVFPHGIILIFNSGNTDSKSKYFLFEPLIQQQQFALMLS